MRNVFEPSGPVDRAAAGRAHGRHGGFLAVARSPVGGGALLFSISFGFRLAG
jgi:hypothetical protein